MHSTVGHLGMTSGQVSSNFVEAQGRTPHCERKKKKKKKMLLRIIVVQRIIKRKFIYPFIPSSNPCLKIVKKTVYR